MSKAQVKAWKRRWELVNAMDFEEAKRKTPEDRLRSLIRLIHFAVSLRRDGPQDPADLEVSARWSRLRKAYASRRPSA